MVIVSTMDILHPNIPAVPHLEKSTGQAAIDQATETLEKWHKDKEKWAARANRAYDETLQAVKDFKNGADVDVEWHRIGRDLRELESELEHHYKHLLMSKANIMAAQGDSRSSGAWFKMRTPDQKLVHQEYVHHLRKQFDKAEESFEELTAWCTRIKRIEQQL